MICFMAFDLKVLKDVFSLVIQPISAPHEIYARDNVQNVHTILARIQRLVYEYQV